MGPLAHIIIIRCHLRIEGWLQQTSNILCLLPMWYTPTCCTQSISLCYFPTFISVFLCHAVLQPSLQVRSSTRSHVFLYTQYILTVCLSIPLVVLFSYLGFPGLLCLSFCLSMIFYIFFFISTSQRHQFCFPSNCSLSMFLNHTLTLIGYIPYISVTGDR